MLYTQKLNSPCVWVEGAMFTGGKQALPAPHRFPCSNPVTNDYRKMTRAIWPIVENPHGLIDDIAQAT